MTRDLVVAAVVAILVLLVVRGCDSGAMRDALARAEAAEDSIAVLTPLVETALDVAYAADTVLTHVTDTVEVEVERIRVERVEILDTLEVHVAPEGVEALEALVESYEAELVAERKLSEERLLWGTSWKDAAELLMEENRQLYAANAALHDAVSASRTRTLAFGTSTLALGGVILYTLLSGS